MSSLAQGRPADRVLIALVGVALVLAGFRVGAAPAAAEESVPPPTAAICAYAAPVQLSTPIAASYVVVNDSTGAIVQVSDITNAGWKPVWNDPRFQQ